MRNSRTIMVHNPWTKDHPSSLALKARRGHAIHSREIYVLDKRKVDEMGDVRGNHLPVHRNFDLKKPCFYAQFTSRVPFSSTVL